MPHKGKSGEVSRRSRPKDGFAWILDEFGNVKKNKRVCSTFFLDMRCTHPYMSLGHIRVRMTHIEPQASLRSVSVAVLGELRRRRWPVITKYELFRLLWDIYEHPEHYPTKILKRAAVPHKRQYERLALELLASNARLLRQDPDFAAYSPSLPHVFRITEIPDSPAEDIFCLVDPFAAIGYLSAMQRYGLSTRQPIALTLLTFEQTAWRQERDAKMLADFGFDPAHAHMDFFVKLTLPTIPSELRSRAIDVQRVKKMPLTQKIADGFARIVKIGDLFAQMLSFPELCGGIRHVLEIWDEHAETYLDPIIEAIGRSDSPILHVRAGYILSERMGVADSRIDRWRQFAQRGGSRKLDPSSPYAPIFSEAWNISLNV